MTGYLKSMVDQISEFFAENKLIGVRGKITAVIAFCFSMMFFYFAGFGSLNPFISKSLLVWMCVVMVFLTRPLSGKIGITIDLVLILSATMPFLLMIVDWRAIQFRTATPMNVDIVATVISIIVVLEATRRRIGLAMPILIIIFCLYGYFGKYMPGILYHRGMSPKAFAAILFMSEAGIFGIPVSVAVNFIMVFMVFGAFLKISGVGEFFIDVAFGGFGGIRGGPAKASVVGSALMGTVVASPVANVVSTGYFTIPLMKRVGYKSYQAAAVEAVSSTGGQIMPPILGAAAFIMADIIGVQYWTIAKSALIPAILYFFACFFMVDLEAGKMGLKGLPRENLPNVRQAMKTGWYLILPIFVLVFLMAVVRYSPQKTAFYTILVIFVLSMFKKKTRITLPKFIEGMISGALAGMEIGVVTASAGILIGIIMRSGLGLSLSTVLINLSGNNLVVLLLLTMSAALIIGMGLPPSACYIITSILIAPAMVKMGVNMLAAHLFVFYFGCISVITPPVAVASFAAAAIAKAPPMKTSFYAVKFGICGFIVPFMFIYGRELLLIGKPLDIIIAFITAVIGVYFLAVGLIGFQFTKFIWPLRVFYVGAALLMIVPGVKTDFIGIGIVAVLSIFNYRSWKREHAVLFQPFNQ